jgi:hypothetical protein
VVAMQVIVAIEVERRFRKPRAFNPTLAQALHLGKEARLVASPNRATRV